MALSETKLKGTGEIDFGKVVGRKSGLNASTRGQAGVALIVRKELNKYVVEWKEMT